MHQRPSALLPTLTVAVKTILFVFWTIAFHGDVVFASSATSMSEWCCHRMSTIYLSLRARKEVVTRYASVMEVTLGTILELSFRGR